MRRETAAHETAPKDGEASVMIYRILVKGVVGSDPVRVLSRLARLFDMGWGARPHFPAPDFRTQIHLTLWFGERPLIAI